MLSRQFPDKKFLPKKNSETKKRNRFTSGEGVWPEIVGGPTSWLYSVSLFRYTDGARLPDKRNIENFRSSLKDSDKSVNLRLNSKCLV